MDNDTARILQLAGELENCLHAADAIGANLAAIKILEALELVLALADRDGQKVILYRENISKPEVLELGFRSKHTPE